MFDENRIGASVKDAPYSVDRRDPWLTRIASLSQGEPNTGNAIIQGDNLATLTHLRDALRARVRCIYLDPPYNNGDRFKHYLDRAAHDVWLAAITERLRVLAELLTEDGSLWISIDDKELHYLKVAADAVFGRDNFITTVVWEQRTTRENRKVFSQNHEYLLVYARNAAKFRKSRNLLPGGPEILARYKNPDADPRGPWQSVSANVQAGHATASQFYALTAPNGRIHNPPNGRCWVYNKNKMLAEISAGRVWFGHSGNGVPRLKRYLEGATIGVTPETLWRASEVGTNDSAKKHLLQMFPKGAIFETPKPEQLVGRIVELSTGPGDLVLDAYLGSGTTAAVAHKMKRRYIGIENGAQAVSYCAKRLKFVVQGEGGGVSRSAGWTGGGGFDFFRAAS